jgi:trehalose 6-phosphate synthase/phosphatase
LLHRNGGAGAVSRPEVVFACASTASGCDAQNSFGARHAPGSRHALETGSASRGNPLMLAGHEAPLRRGETVQRAPAPANRLLIVSNRLPMTVQRSGTIVELHDSVGGLATGLRGPHAQSNGWWIGWPGDLTSLNDAERTGIEERLAKARTVAVEMNAPEIEQFYERLSNGVLWPLFHDRLDLLPVYLDGWDVYERINARFADAVAATWRPGDVVWIHDYQLMRVPALVRERCPEARIGFFLHIPFPNPEIFLTLPVRQWLLEGLLGADLIGFHTRRYRGHFTAALRRVLGLEMDADSHVRHSGRAIRLGVFPMGVDVESIAERAVSRPVNAVALDLKAHPGKLLVGVDRLDYSKGILRRLLAFDRFLERHHEWHGKVRLIQVAVPSRGGVEAYQAFRTEVESAVGRVNGRFGRPDWTPIQYLHREVNDETLLGLYRAADVMVVTPLRDGMNLVAKEFIASRTDGDGALILSEFAGAADELTDALIVNPYDIEGVAAAIQQALTLDGAERRRRMHRLHEQVVRSDVHAWARSFVDAIGPTQSGSPHLK